MLPSPFFFFFCFNARPLVCPVEAFALLFVSSLRTLAQWYYGVIRGYFSATLVTETSQKEITHNMCLKAVVGSSEERNIPRMCVCVCACVLQNGKGIGVGRESFLHTTLFVYRGENFVNTRSVFFILFFFCQAGKGGKGKGRGVALTSNFIINAEKKKKWRLHNWQHNLRQLHYHNNFRKKIYERIHAK